MLRNEIKHTHITLLSSTPAGREKAKGRQEWKTSSPLFFCFLFLQPNETKHSLTLHVAPQPGGGGAHFVFLCSGADGRENKQWDSLQTAAALQQWWVHSFYSPGHPRLKSVTDVCFCLCSGVRTEQDLYVRLIDSMTKQVLILDYQIKGLATIQIFK